MNKLLILFIALQLFSCKKFSHETDQLALSSCKACEYAESLEGNYEGTVTSLVSIPFTSSWHYGSTTMKVNLEHVFLNKGPYIDSNVMFMKFTAIFPEWNDTTSRIFSFEELNGRVSNSNMTSFILTPDSIHFYVQNTGKYNNILTKYTGHRQ